MIADERFTTYKSKEKKQLQEELPKEKKKTRFSIAFQGGFYRSLLWGLILVICGLIALLCMSNIRIEDLNSIKLLVIYVRDNILHNPIVMISSLAVIVGLLSILVRILRKIIMLPKWIIVHFKRLLR